MHNSKRALVACFLMATIIPALALASQPGTQPQGPDEEAVLGTWDMETEFQGQQMPAVMTITMEDGELTGVWASQGMEMKMTNILVIGSKLSFERTMGDGGMVMTFDGTVEGDTISGKWITDMGEHASSGERRK
jgi:hypothetical protein